MDTSSEFLAFYRWCRTQPVYVILGAQGSGTNMLVRLLTRLYDFSVLQDQSLVVSVASRLPPAPSSAQLAAQFAVLRSHMFPSRWSRKLRRRMFHRDETFGGLAH